MNQNLYKELYDLRARIKEDGKRKTGRAPAVCSDDALYAIAEMEPRKLSDLEGIPGVGRTFIETYGQYFISVVARYTTTPNEKTFRMSKIASDTLKELEKKLVSINRRNRLLYMPKIASKYAYDMYSKDGATSTDLLFGSKRVLSLCNLNSADPEEGRKYKSAVSLLREINKDLRDKGQNDLYVGYPFVIGRIPGENFDVRCPLALFPIIADRTSTSISISLDESRDVLYNSTLILAYYKFNNIQKPLPDVVVDDINKGNFLPNLIKFYADNGIHLKIKEDVIKKFTEYSAGEFPHYNPGDLYMEQNIVMGKFPVCSSSIQKDFDAIIAQGQINGLMNELLLEANDLDYDSDAFYGDRENKDKYEKFTLSEHKLVYINELDSSQENVLSAIDSFDKLVIQGPPGTGKSQTITSLIAKFVNDGKTVLMVSEKKTALDVVYSRLGALSKYSLLIDDVGNKELFYRQLERMIKTRPIISSMTESIDEIANEIDRRISKLELIATHLYKVNGFGVEPYKLYIENKRIDFTNESEYAKVRRIHDLLDLKIRAIKYRELISIHEKFDKPELVEQIDLYWCIVSEYPWISDVKKSLNQFDLMDFFTSYDKFKESYDAYMSKPFIAKIFLNGNIKKQAKEIIDKYFIQNEKDILKLTLDNPDNLLQGFKQYQAYECICPIYEQLTMNEKLYIAVVSKIKNMYSSLTEANDGLYNAIISENIMDFENANKSVLATIDNYTYVKEELSRLIARKKELTKTKLEMILRKELTNITQAKRAGEMSRVIEGKRKWAVNRFLSKYSFEIFKGVKVWLLTPEVVSEIIPLESGIFDLVIFDEASQMYVEKGLPSIHRAKKVIVAGDHKQLRPSSLGSGRVGIDEDELPIDEEISAVMEEESLLDLARFKYQDVMLNFHYRARYEELIAFSNYAFYKGRLNVSPNVDKPEKPPIEYHQISDAIWSNRSNMAEAKYVVAKLKDILADRKNEETIGIITFNSNQRDLIMDMIDDQCAVDVAFAAQIRAEMMREKDGEDIGLFIKNIESVQGDERDIIIFSIGYAKNENGRLIRNFGWLNQKGGENRLNVAISRAKTKVHVVASFSPEELQVEDTKNDGPRILKKYLQYSKAVSDGDTNAAKQILMSFGDSAEKEDNISFDSDFEMQVYDALKDKLDGEEYSVETQVGIGGYSIDLAIKKNGKYILGVECDGRTYHSSMSARERDYHRQKYLESRGWKIHRIWSTNWWKNPQREIEKICNVVKSIA